VAGEVARFKSSQKKMEKGRTKEKVQDKRPRESQKISVIGKRGGKHLIIDCWGRKASIHPLFFDRWKSQPRRKKKKNSCRKVKRGGSTPKYQWNGEPQRGGGAFIQADSRKEGGGESNPRGFCEKTVGSRPRRRQGLGLEKEILSEVKREQGQRDRVLKDFNTWIKKERTKQKRKEREYKKRMTFRHEKRLRRPHGGSQQTGEKKRG